MNSRNIAFLVVCIALVASLGTNVYYATRPTAKTPNPPDTLVRAEDFRGTTTFDPAETYGGFNTDMAHFYYDQLLTYEGSGFSSPVPEAAESWTVSPDGLVWTFVLRKGMKFTSGNSVKAQDVVYSFNRVVDLKFSPSFMFVQLGMTNKSTVAVDDYTVKVTLGKKWSKTIVEQAFASWVGSVVDSQVVKANEANNDKGNTWLKVHSAGSGPYKMGTFETDSKLTSDWNPDYWKWSGTTKMRDMPSIKKVICQVVAESQSRLLMLQKGDADIVVGLDTAHLTQLKGKEGYRTAAYRTPSYRGLNMMVQPEYKGKPNPLADNRVRDAVRYSIDYDGILSGLYFGFAWKMQTIIGRDLPGHMPVTPYSKNTTKAKELLTKAGYPNGITVDLMFRDAGDYRTLAEKIQSDFKESGITANLVIVSSAEQRSKLQSRDFQMYIVGFGLDYMDPDAAATPFGHCSSLGKDAPVQLMAWYSGWVNQTVAGWLDEARTKLDWSERAPYYEKIQKEILHNGPYAIILEMPYRYAVTRSWVENVVNNAMWGWEQENVYKES